MFILSIETSCDETACSVVKDGIIEVSRSVSSSKELHEKTGGVVPEIAARKQVEYMVPVINDALEKFCEKENLNFEKVLRSGEGIDAIAVTTGPGLIGSLIVGIEAAKALSLTWNKPLIPVNHLMGHIYANFLNHSEKIEFPAVGLVVSGGHTDLILIKNHDDVEYLGGTIDDAAGEAFDKTARLLGLANYLGGVLLSKKAAECKNNVAAGKLPRTMLDKDKYDFSFSGLKTAVKRLIDLNEYSVEEVACEFENAVVDVIVSKTIKAAKEFNAKCILMGGGVSANTSLRTRLSFEAETTKTPVYYPELSLCGDNASYIASAAYFLNKEKPLQNVLPNPSLGIMDEA